MLEIEEHFERCRRFGCEQYYFDLMECNIKASRPTQSQASSVQSTVAEYCEFIRETLFSPIQALHVAHDPCFPSWLRSFAGAITEPGFRSGLRREVEKALDDPEHARMWEATAREDGLPEWMADLFHILGKASIV